MNFWNKWPYWVRGGAIIGSVLFILDCIYYVSGFWLDGLGCVLNPPVYSAFKCHIISYISPIADFISWPLERIGREIDLTRFSKALGLIFTCAYFFAVGAIISWLYGKIKNRKQIISSS